MDSKDLSEKIKQDYQIKKDKIDLTLKSLTKGQAIKVVKVLTGLYTEKLDSKEQALIENIKEAQECFWSNFVETMD